MPLPCCVPMCNYGSQSYKGEKRRMFGCPKNDPVARTAWIAAIPRDRDNFPKLIYCCEKHFLPSDIITEYECFDEHGNLVKATVNPAKLCPGAIPSRFPDECFPPKKAVTKENVAKRRVLSARKRPSPGEKQAMRMCRKQQAEAEAAEKDRVADKIVDFGLFRRALELYFRHRTLPLEGQSPLAELYQTTQKMLKGVLVEWRLELDPALNGVTLFKLWKFPNLQVTHSIVIQDGWVTDIFAGGQRRRNPTTQLTRWHQLRSLIDTVDTLPPVGQCPAPAVYCADLPQGEVKLEQLDTGLP